MHSNISDRKASAAIGLRSKYQRKASRNSCSASGRTWTVKRVTSRLSEHEPRTMERPALGLHEVLAVGAATPYAMRPRLTPRRLSQGCRSTQRRRPSAPRRRAEERIQVKGPRERSSAKHSGRQPFGRLGWRCQPIVFRCTPTDAGLMKPTQPTACFDHAMDRWTKPRRARSQHVNRIDVDRPAQLARLRQGADSVEPRRQEGMQF